MNITAHPCLTQEAKTGKFNNPGAFARQTENTRHAAVAPIAFAFQYIKRRCNAPPFYVYQLPSLISLFQQLDSSSDPILHHIYQVPTRLVSLADGYRLA